MLPRRAAIRPAAMRVFAVAAATFALTPTAAELGGGRRGVDADRAHLAAAMASTAAATHTVHTLTLANGDIVREFMADDGTVFAVAWAGPARPDLRQLLGAAFDTMQAEVIAPEHRRRGPMTVSRDDLVVVGAGHPGAFHGFAYLPLRIPSGFAADALD